MLTRAHGKQRVFVCAHRKRVESIDARENTYGRLGGHRSMYHLMHFSTVSVRLYHCENGNSFRVVTLPLVFFFSTTNLMSAFQLSILLSEADILFREQFQSFFWTYPIIFPGRPQSAYKFIIRTISSLWNYWSFFRYFFPESICQRKIGRKLIFEKWLSETVPHQRWETIIGKRWHQLYRSIVRGLGFLFLKKLSFKMIFNRFNGFSFAKWNRLVSVVVVCYFFLFLHFRLSSGGIFGQTIYRYIIANDIELFWSTIQCEEHTSVVKSISRCLSLTAFPVHRMWFSGTAWNQHSSLLLSLS